MLLLKLLVLALPAFVTAQDSSAAAPDASNAPAAPASGSAPAAPSGSQVSNAPAADGSAAPTASAPSGSAPPASSSAMASATSSAPATSGTASTGSGITFPTAKDWWVVGVANDVAWNTTATGILYLVNENKTLVPGAASGRLNTLNNIASPAGHSSIFLSGYEAGKGFHLEIVDTAGKPVVKSDTFEIKKAGSNATHPPPPAPASAGERTIGLSWIGAVACVAGVMVF